MSSNYEQRKLHVVLSEVPNEGTTIYSGLIYDPMRVFDHEDPITSSILAGQRVLNFFKPGTPCKIISINTEMYPGEFKNFLIEFLNIEGVMHVGSYYAPFTIETEDITAFWESLTENSEEYFKSTGKG